MYQSLRMERSGLSTPFGKVRHNSRIESRLGCIAWYYVPKSSILLTGTDVWKISSVECAFSSIKIDYSDYMYPKNLRFKGIYLSKALTCMKFFLYKQKMLFYQGGWYLWPHYCMNKLYISHRSLNTLTYSFWAIGSMFISLFRVTSWFDTVCNIVTRWANFRKNSCMIMN